MTPHGEQLVTQLRIILQGCDWRQRLPGEGLIARAAGVGGRNRCLHVWFLLSYASVLRGFGELLLTILVEVPRSDKVTVVYQAERGVVHMSCARARKIGGIQELEFQFARFRVERFSLHTWLIAGHA